MQSIFDKRDYVCKIEGHWTENLLIDGEEYWNMNQFRPIPVRPAANVLDSDARYRDDLQWLAKGDMENG